MRLVECLSASGDSFDVLVLLGQLAWDQNNTADSLGYFLKAAKVILVFVSISNF